MAKPSLGVLAGLAERQKSTEEWNGLYFAQRDLRFKDHDFCRA